MKQRFIEKFMNFFIALILIKVALLIFSISSIGIWDVVIAIVLVVFFGFLVLVFLRHLEATGTGTGFSRNNSSVVIEQSLFDKIRKKYELLAEQYKEEGQYLKASGIYLKLLQNPYRAASILEEGSLYNEAATVYLKKLSNKQSAAQCYEKGKNYKKAIELYKEMGNKEKVGDLYVLLNDRTAANACYESLIDDYCNLAQHVKASLVARYKMQDADKAKSLLLKGWTNNADAFNCINNYFASFAKPAELKKAIADVYAATPATQKETLLLALKYEFAKGAELEETTRDIAYDIIAGHIQKKPGIAAEMKHFNPSDKILIKDIIVYKATANKIITPYVTNKK
jgi:tetratricopeptide (TPR) repeat protein